ncbi:MAG: J domain-containing protein [Deltaproteobacteria bacterium]
MEKREIILKLEGRHCLSCGETENMGRKFYCSLSCRQRLAYKLDLRVGLLQALGTRFATFYFSDTTITMDVLVYRESHVFRFCYPRSFGKKPSDDFAAMADLLGRTWWNERDRTKKRFMASHTVLGQAKICNVPLSSVRPIILQVPSIRNEYLSRLNIAKKDLYSPNIATILKNSYRIEAKKRHPDMGGSPERFKELHIAYTESKKWITNPQYTMRMGFPDKWLYSGELQKWVSPQPRLKK